MSQPSKPLVMITGASSGIGAATAQHFAKLGHSLLLVARRIDKLKALDLTNTLCCKADVTDYAQMERAVAEAEKQFGPLDCVVNNAGVMLLGLVHEQSAEEWQKMFDVNVRGLLNGVRVAIKGMIERKTGTIINVSSVAGRKTFPNHAVYCGTKFAVHAMTENMREEVAPHNVRFITIAPGAVETELLSHTSAAAIKEGYEDWKKSIGGAISADDVARAVTFAYTQPQNVCIREIVLAATGQQP